jgi:hypothetical protein
VLEQLIPPPTSIQKFTKAFCTGAEVALLVTVPVTVPSCAKASEGRINVASARTARRTTETFAGTRPIERGIGANLSLIDGYDEARDVEAREGCDGALYHECAQRDHQNSPERDFRDLCLRFNTRRLLEPIGYVPPAEYEARYYEHLRESTIENDVTAGIPRPAPTDDRCSGGTL